MYLGHEKTQTYLRDTLDAVPGLRNCVRLLKEVVTIKETADGGGFEVTTRDVLGEHDVKSRNRVSTSKTTARVFDAVAVCTGQLSKPSLPGESEIPGLSSFTGQTLHTSEYLDCTSFGGKKVCVVGLGSASGADVAQGTYCISQIPRLFADTRLTLSFIYLRRLRRRCANRDRGSDAPVGDAPRARGWGGVTRGLARTFR